MGFSRQEYFSRGSSRPRDRTRVSLIVDRHFTVWAPVEVLTDEVAQSCPTLCDPWTVAYQVPLSMEFSRQEYWSGLPFPSPGDLPDPGTEPGSPALYCRQTLYCLSHQRSWEVLNYSSNPHLIFLFFWNTVASNRLLGGYKKKILRKFTIRNSGNPNKNSKLKAKMYSITKTPSVSYINLFQENIYHLKQTQFIIFFLSIL